MKFESLPETMPCTACEGTGRVSRSGYGADGTWSASIRPCGSCSGRSTFDKPDMAGILLEVLSKAAHDELVTRTPKDRRQHYVWARIRFETGITKAPPLQPYSAVVGDPYLCMLDRVAEYAAMCLIKRCGPRPTRPYTETR